MSLIPYVNICRHPSVQDRREAYCSTSEGLLFSNNQENKRELKITSGELIIIKSKVPIVATIFRSHIPEAIVPSYSVSYIYMYKERKIPWKLVFVPITNAQSVVCANNRVYYGSKVIFAYLYFTPLSSLYSFDCRFDSRFDCILHIKCVKCLSNVFCQTCV